MKLVYTKKGLEFRKALKMEIEGGEQMDTYYNQNKAKGISRNKLTSFFKPNYNETEGSFKLPEFNNTKVELIKTSRGEVKEKPSVLVGDQEEGMQLSQHNIDRMGIGTLRTMLNDKPNNLHNNASKGMILPPKNPHKSSSIYDILRTVESPSHWRYFENRSTRRSGMFSPISNTMNNQSLAKHPREAFSPEVTRNSIFENSFITDDKILRKHAEQEAKRRMI
mmetsp:Transcript_3418/g.2872  ORF Transcript_3418/g.2872 Transcript_3418/m.2872 type:complete len:222 (+) Transcript_3418:22-687(+)